MRLISFVLLSLMVVCSLDPSVLLTWSALALLLWNVFRARRDIYARSLESEQDLCDGHHQMVLFPKS